MKNHRSKSIMYCLAFILAGLSMTSCNRGYGCPTDFSIADKVVKTATTIVVHQIK